MYINNYYLHAWLLLMLSAYMYKVRIGRVVYADSVLLDQHQGIQQHVIRAIVYLMIVFH